MASSQTGVMTVGEEGVTMVGMVSGGLAVGVEASESSGKQDFMKKAKILCVL